jgi:hypothetical protein
MAALHLDATLRNFVQGNLSMDDYCRKMKSMADYLPDLGCVVSDCNLLLNVLQGLNKRYDHLRTIITCNASFPSFHKVRGGLVLEELTLSLDTFAPPLQAFYSNNTPAPPPPAPSHPLAMAARVKDRVATVTTISRTAAATVAAEAVAATTLPDMATRAKAARLALPCLPGPPSTILVSGPSTCTPI